MAIHFSEDANKGYASLLRESLQDNLFAIEACLLATKPGGTIGAGGCYGYPAAALIFNLIDTVGAVAQNSANPQTNFKILNDKKYFNIDLTPAQVETLYGHCRNVLTHNSMLHPNFGLWLGFGEEPPISEAGGHFVINLRSLFQSVTHAVQNLIANGEVDRISEKKVFQNMFAKKPLNGLE